MLSSVFVGQSHELVVTDGSALYIVHSNRNFHAVLGLILPSKFARRFFSFERKHSILTPWPMEEGDTASFY